MKGSVMTKNSGFTLVELLIVVAILGILAALGIPQLTSYRMKGYNSAAHNDLANFKIALSVYYGDYLRYP